MTSAPLRSRRPWWFRQVRHPLTGSYILLSRRSGRIVGHGRTIYPRVPRA